MTCEPQLVAAASGPGRDRTDGRVPLSPLLPRPEMPCRRHAGAEVLYPLAASVPHGAGALFFDERPQGAGERACPAAPVRIAKMRVASLRVTPCDSQICETAMRSSECPTGRPKKEGRGGFGGCEDRDGREEREVPKVPLQRAPGTHEGFVRAPSGPTGALGKGADAEYFIERRAADKEKARRRRSAGLRKSSCGRLIGREGPD